MIDHPQQNASSVPTPKTTWPTRWRLKREWYRSCYTFNWAHHPLCKTFQTDVLRIGNFHFCRSCTCVYIGIFTTLAAILWGMQPFREHQLAISASVIATTILLSFPAIYKKLPRLLRDLVRFGMGATIVLAISVFWTSYWPLAAGLVFVLFYFWRYYFRLRKIRRAKACQNCPEYGQGPTCSGTELQIASLRKYEEAATEILYSSFK